MKSWYWILVILAGSLPVGSALQFYFAGEPSRNTPIRNWAVVGQAVAGILIMAFGLYKQIQSNRQVPIENDEESTLKLKDED